MTLFNPTLFGAILLGVACTHRAHLSEPRLTPIPTPPNNRPVAIYFPGEKLPEEPYIKIKLITTKRLATRATTEVVQELADCAQQEGADAILVLGKNNFTTTDQTTTSSADSTGITTTTTSSSTDWQSVDALCIKLVRNIDYLDRYVREKRILSPENGNWAPAATLQLDLNGVPVKRSGDANWLALVEDFELGNICPEAGLAGLAWNKAKSGTSETRWFLPWNKNWPLRQYRLQRNPAQQIVALDFRPTPGGKPTDRGHAQYFYDEQDRLSMRLLETSAYGVLFEHFDYDASGKCRYANVFREKDGLETPMLRVEYTYFQNSDLPALLQPGF